MPSISPYKFKDGNLDTAKLKAVDVPDQNIKIGRDFSWSKISGFWIGKHDLFEAYPDYSQIGRAENFFLAAAFAELLEPEFSAEAMKDLRGGSIVVRLYTPGTDNPVYYKIQKNLLSAGQLPEMRHKGYWVYMLEKAFAVHAMQCDGSGKVLNYMDALTCPTFDEALQMLTGKTKAAQMTKWDTPVGKVMQKLTSWTGKDRSDAALKAIRQLSELKLFHPYASRAVALLAFPGFVDQDSFGVCGMASTIFVLLSLQPSRFVELLRAIFNNEIFKGGISKIKAPVKIHPGQTEYKTILKSITETPVDKNARPVEINALLAGRIKQYEKKHDESGLKSWTKLDFIVSRALAKMLKIVDPALYNEQKAFTEKFLVKGSPLGVKFGDLAFTEMGIQLMLTDIIGVEKLRFVPAINDASTMIGALNKWFTERKNDGPFAIVAVNDAGKWIGKGQPPVQKWNPSGAKSEFTHWVVITGEIKDLGLYVVPIWTWGAFYSRQLPKDKTAGYLYSVILSCLKPD